MTKRGDLLNQLAIISDLIEKLNLSTTENNIVLTVEQEEFDRCSEYFSSKDKTNSKTKITHSLKVHIGEVNILILNKNNA